MSRASSARRCARRRRVRCGPAPAAASGCSCRLGPTPSAAASEAKPQAARRHRLVNYYDCLQQ
eukprot:5860210-Prymnesium_polylepis.1